MNSLPPLPLIDGHLFIDNSFLEKLNSCPRACEYAYLHRRVAAYSSSALNFGGAIHHALAYRYIHSPDMVLPETEAIQIQELEKWFAEKPNALEDHRTLDLAQALIRGYNSRYLGEEFRTLDLNGKPAVELPFAFPLYKTSSGITIMYCGRIDLPVHIDGQLFVVDHKTTSMLGDQFFKGLSVSPQMLGYCSGIETILPGEKCAGFLVNAIRVPKPTKREGMVIKPDDFQRSRTYIQDGQLVEWRRNLISLVDEFLWHYSQGYLPQKKSWCVNKFGMCEYFGVCELPPENRDIALSTGMFSDNIWSPLNDFNQTLQQFTTKQPTE